MKMSGLSAGTWTFLLLLAAAMLFSASEGQDFRPLSCCRNLGNKFQGRIEKCFEQKPRSDCNRHAFMIKYHNKFVCINPNAPWIKARLAKGLQCPPDVSFPQ